MDKDTELETEISILTAEEAEKEGITADNEITFGTFKDPEDKRDKDETNERDQN